MSSLTQVEFIQQLHLTRKRFTGTPHLTSTRDDFDNDNDKGLVMKIDSRLPLPANICSESKAVVDLALTSVTILNAIPEVMLKHLYKATQLLQKKTAKLLPLLLYASLLFLGCQAVAVVVLLTSAILSIGLLFLLGCIGMLGALFIYTWSIGQVLPTTTLSSPSHSSSSLCLYPS